MDELKVIWVISKLKGGGAEHVMMQLANYFYSLGFPVKLLVTNQLSSEADLEGLQQEINVDFLEDAIVKAKGNIGHKVIGAICKIFEKLHLAVPDVIAEHAFMNVYGEHVSRAKAYIDAHPGWKIVAFLQPSNQIILKAANDQCKQVIISERADPKRYFKSRYAPLFLKKYYPYIGGAVFQTYDAMYCYPETVQKIGSVILNPISEQLPQAYFGVRKKKIVNFCRLAKQKNLPLLIDAFDIFAEKHSDYILEIIGDGELKNEITDYIKQKKHAASIRVLPHSNNIHQMILDYAMFVSSSDYEGMSNSMLEAMAIGMPTICTDCPIGGASAVIRDHENGILVPVNDVSYMAKAMAEIADNPQLAEKLSKNAMKIRIDQNINIIGDAWVKVVYKAGTL